MTVSGTGSGDSTSTARSDERLDIAYSAAVKAVEQQDATLSNLRNRATGLLSAVTIGTTFGAGVGLFSTDPTKGVPLPGWAKGALLVLLIAVGGLCLSVLWPVTMVFGVAPDKVVARLDQGDDIDTIRRYVVDELIVGHRANQRALKTKFRLYRYAVIALTMETVVLLAALLANGQMT